MPIYSCACVKIMIAQLVDEFKRLRLSFISLCFINCVSLIYLLYAIIISYISIRDKWRGKIRFRIFAADRLTDRREYVVGSRRGSVETRLLMKFAFEFRMTRFGPSCCRYRGVCLDSPRLRELREETRGGIHPSILTL